MNRHIIIMRHAKAQDFAPSRKDFDRALAPEGIDCGAYIGQQLAKQLSQLNISISHVICSAATRTQQTLQQVQKNISLKPDIIDINASIYEASVGTLLSEISSVPDKVSCLLFIGHNPGVSLLAESLFPTKAGGAPYHFSPATFLIGTLVDLPTWAAISTTKETIVQHYLRPETTTWSWPQ